MRYLKYFAVLGLLVVFAGTMAGSASAQVRVGIGIGVAPVYVGPAPVCAYGYYPFYPYACAPYGYYGPQWFVSGLFIGAGPWFHGFGHPVVVERGIFRPGFVARDRDFVGRRDFDRDRGFERRSPDRDFHGGGGFRGGRR